MYLGLLTLNMYLHLRYDIVDSFRSFVLNKEYVVCLILVFQHPAGNISVIFKAASFQTKIKWFIERKNHALVSSASSRDLQLIDLYTNSYNLHYFNFLYS